MDGISVQLLVVRSLRQDDDKLLYGTVRINALVGCGFFRGMRSWSEIIYLWMTTSSCG